jgi:hypothetical protein
VVPQFDVFGGKLFFNREWTLIDANGEGNMGWEAGWAGLGIFLVLVGKAMGEEEVPRGASEVFLRRVRSPGWRGAELSTEPF